MSITSAMPTSARESINASEPVEKDEQTCDVCAHPYSAHDPIALRFCKATMSSARSRGCICSA